MYKNQLNEAKQVLKSHILEVLDECDDHNQRKEFLAFCRNLSKKLYQKECLDMGKQDQERLTQCIFCAKDPRSCNCTEADEDENGMCLRYERRADEHI